MAGTISTPLDLINICLLNSGIIGEGQTASSETAYSVFVMLNAMLGQWSKKRWLVYHLVDISFTSNGSTSYGVGAGQQFNVARPDRLEAAYVRLLPTNNNNPVDFPLRLIQSREDYSSISLKQIQTFPTCVFLDSDYPVGKLYVWPLPASGKYEIHIIVKETLPQFSSLTSPIVLPPEYIETLIWNLTAKIRPMFQLGPDATVVALAKSSLNVLRQANAQVPSLRLPGILLNSRSGGDITLGNMAGLPWSI